MTEEGAGVYNNKNNTNIMNNTDLELDLIRGTDRFLRLHIDDLSKLTLNETKQRRPNADRSLTPVIVSATITGILIGTIAAYLLGLVP